jgi:hypothetical protein
MKEGSMNTLMSQSLGERLEAVEAEVADLRRDFATAEAAHTAPPISVLRKRLGGKLSEAELAARRRGEGRGMRALRAASDR